MTTFRGFLDVRPEERRNTFAAFGTLLGITTGHTLLETARDALFLAKLPAAELPWMYLIIVVVALGLGRISRKADSRAGITSALAFAAVVTAGFWWLTHSTSSRWELYGLYVWSGLFASWVTVQFWTLLGRIHTMTQAKRLYGFIGAGAVLGAVLGALLARGVIAAFSPRSTLLLAAAVFLLAAIPCAAVKVPPRDREREREAEPATPEAKRRGSMSVGMSLLWQNVFARRVLAIGLFATISLTLGDFLFKSTIAQHYGTDVRALGAYLSTFYAVTNALSLVAQLFIAPWVFRTMGVQRALFFFPVAIVLAGASVLGTGGALGAAVLLKALDGTLRYSLHKTSTELLLVPVPDGTRERIKPIIDLVGTRGGQALASIAILALVAIGAAGTMTVAALVLLLAVVWLGLVFTIRRAYLDVFRETLKSGGLSGKAELPELDLGALETLFANLNSSRDADVLAALDLLAEQHRERLIPALILYHPSRDVVLRALEIFTRLGRVDFASIADRLNGHPDREIASAALRARAAVLPDRKLLRLRLGDESPEVAATALVALMAYGWIDPKDADARMSAIVKTRDGHTAAEIARGIRDLAGTRAVVPRNANQAARRKQMDEHFDAILVRLARESTSFHDPEDSPAPPRNVFAPPEPTPDIRVRLEVARAMAERRSPAFLPLLIGMLSRHELRATARDAIVEIPGAIGVLEAVLENADLSRNVRVHVPRTLSLLDPEAAVRVLLPRLLTEGDGAVRFKIIRALVKIHRTTPSLAMDEALLQRAIDANLEHAAELRRWGIALSKGGEAPTSLPNADPLRAAHHLLVDLVRDKLTHATQRLFLLLELLHGEDFDDIARGLRSKNPRTRASSLELIENVVRPPPLRDRVLDLVGDGAPDSDEALGYEAALREILAQGGHTMRTLAEYCALEIGMVTADPNARPSEIPTMESIGRRLLDRARDVLRPEPMDERRAPA